MRELVSDAHAFLWHLYRPVRLRPAARQAFEAADAGEALIHLPAVAVAEALMVAQKRRIPGLTLERLLPHLEAIHQNDSFFQLADLQASVVLESHKLIAIPDIFDRLIVAEAIHRELPLITRDATIRESGLVEIVWD